jgi:DNA-binding Lrp family transcriptional regulator
LKIHDYLLKMPYLSITKVAKLLDISVPTVTTAVQKLVSLGVLKEITGNARNRLFGYTEYLAILSAGTDQYGTCFGTYCIASQSLTPHAGSWNYGKYIIIISNGYRVWSIPSPAGSPLNNP